MELLTAGRGEHLGNSGPAPAQLRPSKALLGGTQKETLPRFAAVSSAVPTQRIAEYLTESKRIQGIPILKSRVIVTSNVYLSRTCQGACQVRTVRVTM